MIRTGIGILVFLLCAITTWSLSLRFFASRTDVCFHEGPGWQIGFAELLAKFRWTSDLFVSSIAPYLPFVLFMGPKQPRSRQLSMLAAMILTIGALSYFNGPVKPDWCDSKGPFPEIGYLLLGVIFSLPTALTLAHFTRPSRPMGAS